MSEKVEIIVTAKDGASQILRGISSSFGGIGSAVQMLTSGGSIEALASQVVKFGKESIDATVAYADEVRRLSQISGQSAEETSRLIQLSDDYKISAGDLTVAMRKLTSEGLTLNVETLSQLSDEYMKLNPGQERAAFLMEKFGRQGVKFAEIMGKGGDEIQKLNDGIDKNLLLTAEGVKQAREYEMALDSWEEQTLKLSYAFGTSLIPTLTNGLNLINKSIDEQGLALGILNIGWDDVFQVLSKQPAAVTDLSNSLDDMSAATTGASESAADLAAAEKLAAEAAKVQSDANNEYLSLLQDMTSAEKDYNSEMMNITQERSQIEKERADELSKGWQTSKEKVAEYDNQLVELDAKVSDTASKHKEATDAIILSNVLAKLSVDNLTDAELDQYLTLEVVMGKITEKDKELALGQQKLIDAFVQGKLGAENLKNAIDMLPSGKSIDVIMNMVTRSNSIIPAAYKVNQPRASGGPVSAGEWYRVNETNQEYFRPTVGGSVMPIGSPGGGSGVTVVIQADTIIGDRAHVESYLLPVIREGLRQVNAGR